MTNQKEKEKIHILNKYMRKGPIRIAKKAFYREKKRKLLH
jgi:hypothetical protein